MFKELILSRRSIRKFTDENLTDEFINKIYICSFFSPSSRGKRGYKIILVRDKEMLLKLSKSKIGAELIKGAKLGVVIIGEPEKSDVWIEDCSIVATNILNLCEEEKLGACWVQIRNRNHKADLSADCYVKQLLEIPDNFSTECIIAIGHPATTLEKYDESKVDVNYFFNEKFGKH